MFDSLYKTSFTYPAIDNHAHNIVKASKKAEYPLHGLATVSYGNAANDDMKHTLALKRAAKQLAELYSCNPDWEAVEKKRESLPYDDVCKMCFEPTGIQCVLFDDHIVGMEEDFASTAEHYALTASPNRKIMRIETVAELLIMEPQTTAGSSPSRTSFNCFLDEFSKRIQACCDDPEVVGFKSVACYRGGLDISPDITDQECYAAFTNVLRTFIADGKKEVKLATKHLNDKLLCIALGIAGAAGKPVQFHAGFGDRSIELRKSSPASMQDLIRTFPKTKFVLLHASYPFTQEAGYLTSSYENVYLDFGEIWPGVNAEGQRQVIREVLELCPTNKILWSTDGHYWPETFYLGALQGRQALYEVLSDIVTRGDLTEKEAIEIVENALFHNSNNLYKLNLKPSIPSSDTIPRALGNPVMGLSLLDALPSSVKNIRIQWVDLINTLRYRVVPCDRFRLTLHSSMRGGMLITKAVFFLSQGDAPAEGFSPVGEWIYVPDLTSLMVCGYADSYASVMGYFEGKDGRKCEMCPRGVLKELTRKASKSGIEFLAGFETEFILVPEGGINDRNPSEWCVSKGTLAGSTEIAIMEAIQEALEVAKIEVQCWHSESAPGQYEVVTGPLPPLEAADALVAVRDTVYNVANKFGMRATLAPKVDQNAAGSGAHVHVSLRSPSKTRNSSSADVSESLTADEASFLQGILTRLPSICMFTLPLPVSYTRVVDGAWSGGTWVAWGRDNKECPIRLCGNPGSWNFEVKALDGTANPYLALTAILSAGLLGIEEKADLTAKDCTEPPALMSEKEREKHGITQRMPRAADVAQKRLLEDKGLVSAIGADLVNAYISVNNHLGEVLKGHDLNHLMKRY